MDFIFIVASRLVRAPPINGGWVHTFQRRRRHRERWRREVRATTPGAPFVAERYFRTQATTRGSDITRPSIVAGRCDG
jgi:hypothetical protein